MSSLPLMATYVAFFPTLAGLHLMRLCALLSHSWTVFVRACIYLGLRAVGNLSIFKRVDGGQVNCCFPSHFFPLSEQGLKQKAKL